MKYMGSKNRIAKHILPIMLAERRPNQVWVEPFVGGANMIDKVDGVRIGSDLNEYVIALLQEMTNETFTSPSITAEDYQLIKDNKDRYPKWLVGYAGTQLSFGATWFGSYCKDKKGVRNYSEEAMRNVDKQAKNLKGVNFVHCSYNELEIPPQSLIYCDPPYDTKATKFKYKDAFNHGNFWQWCRDIAKAGHTVFISEYNAPSDFRCVWEKKIAQRMNNNVETEVNSEKLFTI